MPLSCRFHGWSAGFAVLLARLGDSGAWLEGISEAKIADFAGEAMAADAAVMRDVAPLKRMALLACVVHVARTRSRDDLAEMFCKRMAQVTKLAKAALAEIREHGAEMSERLIVNYPSVLGCLDPRNAEAADAAAALRLARRTVADAGGFEAQLARYRGGRGASRQQLRAAGRQASPPWERRRGAMLTLEGYRQAGGVPGALAQRADQIFGEFSPEQQQIARRTLLRLTQPGEGTEDPRRRAPRSELSPAEDDDSFGVVLARLVDARLLTTGRDEIGQQVIDVSHGALIRGWPRLRGWIDADRAGLLIHRRLTDAAHQWDSLNRDAASLYRGVCLATAREWATDHDDTSARSSTTFSPPATRMNTARPRGSSAERAVCEL